MSEIVELFGIKLGYGWIVEIKKGRTISSKKNTSNSRITPAITHIQAVFRHLLPSRKKGAN